MTPTYPHGLRWVLAQFVPRRSALRRRGDRLELAARWVVLLLVLCALPVTLAGGSEVRADVARSIALEQAERRPARAVVLAPARLESSAGAASADRRIGTVRWTAADGTPRVGHTSLEASQVPGDRTTVWLDEAGALVPRPRPALEATVDGAVAAIGLFAAVSVAGGLLLGGLRRLVERRHLREWEKAWRRFSAPGAGSVR